MAAPRLDAVSVGHGRPLVLLHSLLSDRSSFDPLLERIGRERRLVLVNLPGFGRSTGTVAQLEDFSEAVARLFDELDLPGECDVLGNGFGGFVALKLAAAHGGRFDRLVLVGSAIAFPETGRATFRALADKVDAEGMAAVATAAVQRMFPEDYIASHPEVAQTRAAVFKSIDPAVFTVACRALSNLDLAPELARIANPALIVVGERDSATPPALAHALAQRLPRARVVVLPGLGHYPQMQDPDAFVAAIADFLELKRDRTAHAQ